MAKVRLLNPETGNIGELDTDQAEQAVRDGMQIADPQVELYNPETKATATLAGEQATSAVREGMSLSGSRSHRVHEKGDSIGGRLESAGRGALQGATLGFADELLGVGTGAGKLLFGEGWDAAKKEYNRTRDEWREGDREASEANPWTYGLSQAAGGFAVPIPGGIAKSVGGRLAQGTAMGAVGGAGLSEGDSATKIAKDALVGGGIGLGASGLVEGVGKLARGFNNKVVEPFLDTDDAAARALGGGSKEFDPIRGANFQEEAVNFKKAGMFKEGGVFDPKTATVSGGDDVVKTREALFNNAQDILDQTGSAFERGIPEADALMQQAGGADKFVASKARQTIDDLIDNVAFQTEHQEQSARGLIDRFEEAISTSPTPIETMQQIKNKLQAELQKAGYYNDPKVGLLRPTLEVKAALASELRQSIEDTVGLTKDLAPKGSYLSEMAPIADINKLRGTIKQVLPSLGKSIGVDATRERNFVTNAATATGATAGAMLGGAPGAQMGAVGGLLYGTAKKFMQSGRGQLMRLQMGEKLPRTVNGIKQFVADALPELTQQFPTMAGAFNALASATEDQAAKQVRLLMPAFAQYLEPAEYPSMLDGKVSSAADMVALSKRIDDDPNLPLMQKAKLSSDAHTGLVPSIYIKTSSPQAKPAGQWEDDMLSFQKRLSEMGY